MWRTPFWTPADSYSSSGWGDLSPGIDLLPHWCSPTVSLANNVALSKQTLTPGSHRHQPCIMWDSLTADSVFVKNLLCNCKLRLHGGSVDTAAQKMQLLPSHSWTSGLGQSLLGAPRVFLIWLVQLLKKSTNSLFWFRTSWLCELKHSINHLVLL
jgi:hypothetical protein